jgi:hypothetical protein
MTRIRHLLAVQALEEEATDRVLAALRDVMKDVTDVINPITAAAEPQPSAESFLSADDLAHIQTGWTAAVDGSVLPWYRTVFIAGADAATDQVAAMREIATEIIGDGDPLLINEAATRHLATARNRFLLVGQETWAAARNELLAGFAEGEGIDPIRRRLQDVVDLSKAQAIAIARTEVISASNAGAITRVRAMGSDAPKFKQWLATNDARTRPSHRAANNTVVPIDAKFEVGDARLDYPGDPTGPDSETVNCRCTPIFVDDPGSDSAGLDLADEVASIVAAAHWTDHLADPWQLGVQLERGGVNFGIAKGGVRMPVSQEILQTDCWQFDSPHSVTSDMEATPAGVDYMNALADAAAVQIDSTTGETHTGTMIALVPTDPESLAVDGGEPADQLHVTLWFLGEVEAIPAELQTAILSNIGDVATRLPPVDAQVFGAAVWNPTGDAPCCVLSVGGSGLDRIRDLTLFAVVEADAGQTDGWLMPDQHTPWAAHMCVAYTDDPPAVMPDALLTVGPLMLDTIRVAFGGETHDILLTGDTGDFSEAEMGTEIASAQVTGPDLEDNQEADMPYGIRRGGTDCPFEVYNSDTDERAPGGCHATRQEALDHQQALMVNVPDAAAAGYSEGDCPPGHHMMPDGECMPDGDMAVTDVLPAQPGEHFHAIMHTQGLSTGFRTFNDLSWREPPFAYHWQRSSSAHGGMPETFQVGLVNRVMPDPDNPEVLHAWGVLDLNGDLGAEYARMLVDGFARWVSIGLDEQPTSETIIWPEDSDGKEDDFSKLFDSPDQVIINGGRIGELCGVSVPAQDNATVEPTAELVDLVSRGQPGETVVAAAVADVPPAAAAMTPDSESTDHLEATVDTVADIVQGLTAAAHRIEIPHVPPRWWFDEPTDVDIAGALYVTDEGRIYGALAPLGVNHRAFSQAGRRQEVPFGNVDYGRFMGAVALTQTGRIPAGPVTMDCGHANRFRTDHDQAPAHYDNACTVVAKICVGESRERGIVWAAGALEPAVTVDQVSRMLACRLSGDWQPHSDRAGWQELIAALLVPSPGFPMEHGGARVDLEEGVLVASSVPVRAVGASTRPRLRIDRRAGTVARVVPLTAREQVAAIADRVRGEGHKGGH